MNRSLQLSVFDSDGRAESWPRLLHSANSSQLEVWLDGIMPRSANSRFLLEMQAVGGDFPLSRVDVRQFIDDEFTPSIFKVTYRRKRQTSESEPNMDSLFPSPVRCLSGCLL